MREGHSVSVNTSSITVLEESPSMFLWTKTEISSDSNTSTNQLIANPKRLKSLECG